MQIQLDGTSLLELCNRRILILGATGWLGQTIIREMGFSERSRYLLCASYARTLRVGPDLFKVQNVDMTEIRRFKPEIVINCAFLTREKVETLGIDEFIRVNQILSSNFLEIATLSSVEVALTISSGSATLESAQSIELNPYGYLKRIEQENLLSLSSSSLNVGVARAWSLSGDLVPLPAAYAFSDFVWQALKTHSISVKAQSEVWRRYCDAGQFLRLVLLSTFLSRSSIVDSGGPLIEVRDLASKISESHDSVTVYKYHPHGIPDNYYSSGDQYEKLCVEFGFPLESIDDQIKRISTSFRNRINGS